MKNSQRVRFSIEKFTTCQILVEKLHSKNHFLSHFTPWKRHFLLFCAFLGMDDFEINFLQRVGF